MADVVAVLDALDLGRASYWGYSMGGSIGLGLAVSAPERLVSLLAGGASAEALDIGTKLRHVDGRDPEAFVAAFDSFVAAPFSREYRAMLLASDTRALAAAANDRPSLNDGLTRIVAPCLLYAGDRDFNFANARATARRIPRATFVSLPGLDHPEGFARSEVVVPHVLPFLRRAHPARADDDSRQAVP